MTQTFRMRVGQRAPDGHVSAVAIDVNLACEDAASAREAARSNLLEMLLEAGNYAWITDGDTKTVWSLKLEEE